MHTAIQLAGLFVGIWLTFVNVLGVQARQTIPTINFVLMAAAWTAFIWATWLS